jgi:hypothetical protein
MDTETEICNLALSEIGAKLVSNYEEDSTEEARVCRLHFAQTRDALLRRHQWNFAQVRADLSQVTGTPVSDWDSAWQLPTDCVRVISLPSENPYRPHQEFAIEGRLVLVRDLAAVTLLYVSNAVPVTSWDPLFIDALSLSLAVKLAKSLSHDVGMSQAAAATLAQLALPAAFTADARESMSNENSGPAWRRAKSSIVAIRGGSRGGYSGTVITPIVTETLTVDLDGEFEAAL